MGFEKLQKRLQEFFRAETEVTVNNARRAHIRERALAEFSKKSPRAPWQQIWQSSWVRSATFGAIILSLFPLFGAERSAGELNPTGLVEIVRDGEVFVATEKTPLQIGDQILVGNNASAEIQLRKSLNTVAGERAEIRIPRSDSLFLVKGSLDGNLSGGSIETNRGKIDATNTAELNVAVSDSGEAHIRPRENDIWVTAWNQERSLLAEGEELRLQTDTQLPPEIPEDLRLSSSQILAIRAKLLMARTKALNSIEARLQQNNELALAEFESANRTFLSVAQVLKSSRNLQVLRRENLNLIQRKDVIERLTARTERENLLENAYAVDTLLDIVETERDPQFLTIDSGLLIFNRYALLQRLFAPLPAELRARGWVLQEQYIAALAQQIMNADSPEEEMISAASLIPKSGAGRQFLQQVQRLLPDPQKETLGLLLEDR
jgi:hypothetical protein